MLLLVRLAIPMQLFDDARASRDGPRRYGLDLDDRRSTVQLYDEVRSGATAAQLRLGAHICCTGRREDPFDQPPHLALQQAYVLGVHAADGTGAGTPGPAYTR